MVGHQQTEPAMPQELIVIMSHGSQNAIARLRATQLIFSLWQTFDGDEEPASIGHPLWDSVRQHLANGQIHVRTITVLVMEASAAGRAGSPLHAAGRGFRDGTSHRLLSAGRGLPALPFVVHLSLSGYKKLWTSSRPPLLDGRAGSPLPAAGRGFRDGRLTAFLRRAEDCPPYLSHSTHH